MRIIQRFGRVDRVGSSTSSIQLVNYWPAISLDECINIEERVESMMIADGIANQYGVPSTVLIDQETC